MSYHGGRGGGGGGFRATNVFYDATYPEHIDYVDGNMPGARFGVGNYVGDTEMDYTQPYETQVQRSFTGTMRGRPVHGRGQRWGALNDAVDGLGGVLAIL